VPAPADGSAAASKAHFVVVHKRDRRMLLLRGGQVLREYRIALGGNPLGAKQQLGDGRTPEGEYLLDWRNEDSDFHRSIHVSYPNAEDLQRAEEHGVQPGGGIMIHGLPNGESWIGEAHRGLDWTKGCIAVTDQEMDEIWGLVDDGTPIDILP
jgi:murein L,D-transpeptidase YafK